MTRTVYFTNEQGQYVGKREVGNDYELGYGELFDQPLMHPAFYSDNGWINGEEPTISIPEPQPSEADKQVAQLTYQQMMTTQDVTTLQTQNAQMAYQLMMMQKQGGEA